MDLQRNKRMRNFASYAMPLIWNSLPLQTKRITSINALKKNYTATLKSNYANVILLTVLVAIIEFCLSEHDLLIYTVHPSGETVILEGLRF